MIWLTLALWAASTIVTYLLRPKVTSQQSSVSKIQAPTAAEGIPIPVPYGTCLVKSPNVLWYGNYSWRGLSTDGQPVSGNSPRAYAKYFLGMQLGICYGPVDDVHQIFIDDHDPAFTKAAPDGNGRKFSVNRSTFAGLSLSDGGLQGDVQTYFGGAGQARDTYLSGQVINPLTSAPFGADWPTYANLCYASVHAQAGAPAGYEGFYWGNSPYIKAMSFVVQRCPAALVALGLTSGHHKILSSSAATGLNQNGADYYDANPAAIIYDLLTDPNLGIGLSPSLIDAAGFVAVAETLFTEGLGMSWMVSDTMTAEDAIKEILRHIDGVFYTDPTTGKITIRLARADYVVASLPILTRSMISKPKVVKADPAETKNDIKIGYIDCSARFLDRMLPLQDLASIQSQNGDLTSEDFQFKGISNPTNAAKIASRVLRVVSYPLATFSFEMDRSGWALRPGDVVRVQLPRFGFPDSIVRITQIRGGTLTNGRIAVDGVEDVFGVSYQPVPPTVAGWTSPKFGLLESRAEEAPLIISGTTSAKVMVMAARNGSGVASAITKFDLYSKIVGSAAVLEAADVTTFTPMGFLAADLAQNEIEEMTWEGLLEEALFDTYIATTPLDPDTTQHTVTAVGSKTLTATLPKANGYFVPGIARNVAGDERRVTIYTTGVITLVDDFPAGTVIAGDPILKYVYLSRDALATGNTIALVGDEMIGFSSITKPALGGDVVLSIPGSMKGLARNVGDTSCVAHPKGTPVWFVKSGVTLFAVNAGDVLPGGSYAGHNNYSRTYPDYGVFCVAKTASAASSILQTPNAWAKRPVTRWINRQASGNSKVARAARIPCPVEPMVNGIVFNPFFSHDAIVTVTPRSNDGTGEPIQKGFRSGAVAALPTSPAAKVAIDIWSEVVIDGIEAKNGGQDFLAVVEARIANAGLIGGRASATLTEAADIAANSGYPFLDGGGGILIGSGRQSTVIGIAANEYDDDADADGNDRTSWAELSWKAKRTGLIAPPTSAIALTFIAGQGLANTPATSITATNVSLNPGEYIVGFVQHQPGTGTLERVDYDGVLLNPILTVFSGGGATGETGSITMSAYVITTSVAKSNKTITAKFAAANTAGTAEWWKVTGLAAPLTLVASGSGSGKSVAAAVSCGPAITLAKVGFLACMARTKETGDGASAMTWQNGFTIGGTDYNGNVGGAFSMKSSSASGIFSGNASPLTVTPSILTNDVAASWCMIGIGFADLALSA